jgi:hypothetical protein
VLLSGGPNQYKSCIPPFAQPSEAQHAIREIYFQRLQSPDKYTFTTVRVKVPKNFEPNHMMLAKHHTTLLRCDCIGTL